MGKELVPQELFECAGHTCKNRERVGFEILDCSFRCVVAVHAGSDDLEGCFSLFFNLEFVCCIAFIIEILEVGVVAILLEAGHNLVVCSKAVAVVAGMERFGQDEIGVYVIGKHDEVVAAVRADEETTHAVGVKFADGIYPEVELFRLCGRKLAGCCVGGRRFSGISRFCRIGGANALPHFFMWHCRMLMETGQ